MHLLHEITSFGPSLQLCSHMGWGRQQQDPGEPGRCGVGSASESSPARGCSACSALVLSAGSQHLSGWLGWAALPLCCIPGLPAEGSCTGRIWAGNNEERGHRSGPAPAAGSWTQLPPAAPAHCRESRPIPAVGVCCHVSGSLAHL